MSGIATTVDIYLARWNITVAGIDVGVLGADGRPRQIAAFVGDLPQEDTP